MKFSIKELRKNKYFHYLIVFIIFTFLAINFLTPDTKKLDNNLFIYGGGLDTYGTMWNLWWFNKAVTELNVNPLYTDYIFSAFGGTSLLTHATSMFNSFLSIPLQYVFDLYTTWNILILLTFSLAGLGTYSLVYYLTKNKLASFVSGFIYAFSSYHVIWLGILNLVTIQFIPFYVLFLIRTLNGDSSYDKYIASLFLFLTLLSSWYYIYFSIIFTVFYVGYLLFLNRHKMIKVKSILKDVSIIFLLFFIISLPIILPTWNIINNIGVENVSFENDYNYENLEKAKFFSVDIISFFIPPPTNIFLGDFFNEYNKTLGLFDESKPLHTYFGISIIFLLLVYLFHVRKSLFWPMFLLFSILVVVGPNIIIAGNLIFDSTFIWEHIPFLILLSSPYVFSVMLFLSLAVIAGYSLSYILNSKYKFRKILIISILLLVFIEYSSFAPSQKIYEPEFFKDISNDGEDVSILYIPINASGTGLFQKSMLHQTIHNKKLIIGHISKIPKNVRNNITQYEIFQVLIHEVDLNENSVTYFKELLSLVENNQLKYVIFEKKYPNEINEEFMKMFELILDPIDVNEIKIYEDIEIIVYVTI